MKTVQKVKKPVRKVQKPAVQTWTPEQRVKHADNVRRGKKAARTRKRNAAKKLGPADASKRLFKPGVHIFRAGAQTRRLDAVNPKHYVGKSGREVVDHLEDFGFENNAYRFQAMMYLFRAGRKNRKELKTDLRKAVWFIERELSLLK